nr:MAG TPA: hypothetical protein [Caudoviricetes sp.]
MNQYTLLFRISSLRRIFQILYQDFCIQCCMFCIYILCNVCM